MKNKYLKYTLLSVAITSSLLFTACGKKSEPVNEAPETTAIVETTTTEESEPVEEIPVEEETIIEEEITDTEISSITLIEELNTQLYVIKESNILDADNNDAKIITPVEFGVPLEVTGKTSNGWYEVVWATTKGYLPAEVLSDTNPNPAPDMNEVITEDGRTTEEVLEDFWELMGEGYDDGTGTGGISQDAIDNQSSAVDLYESGKEGW